LNSKTEEGAMYTETLFAYHKIDAGNSRRNFKDFMVNKSRIKYKVGDNPSCNDHNKRIDNWENPDRSTGSEYSEDSEEINPRRSFEEAKARDSLSSVDEEERPKPR
jgi:hypothetical protein